MAGIRFNGYTIVGSVIATTDENGVPLRAVLPQVQMVGAGGAVPPAGSVGDPSYTREVGSASIATGQVNSSISPATAAQVVAARAGRRAVTITNITGAQPVYITATAATTGVTSGHFIAASAGASITIPTASAVFATSPTAAQTLSFVETFG